MRTMLTLTAFLALAGTAQAADEFGARFNDGAPAALETPADPAQSLLDLQSIAPAAGEEAVTVTPAAKLDPATGTLTENPARDILKIESTAPAAKEETKEEPKQEASSGETPKALSSEEATAEAAPAAIEPAAGDEQTQAPPALEETSAQ